MFDYTFCLSFISTEIFKNKLKILNKKVNITSATGLRSENIFEKSSMKIALKIVILRYLIIFLFHMQSLGITLKALKKTFSTLTHWY